MSTTVEQPSSAVNVAAPIRVILFDAVGTLIYAEPGVTAAYHALGHRFGSKKTPEQVHERFQFAFRRDDADLATNEDNERRRWQRIVTDVFDDVSATQVEPLFLALWDHFAEPRNWRLFDDVRDTLIQLSEFDVTVGIASNFDSRLEPICDALAPLDQVPLRFISSQIGFAKPSPQFFAKIAERLGILPQEILFVGDDVDNDYAGALAAGFHAILIDRSMNRANADSISSLSHVLTRASEVIRLRCA